MTVEELGRVFGYNRRCPSHVRRVFIYARPKTFKSPAIGRVFFSLGTVGIGERADDGLPGRRRRHWIILVRIPELATGDRINGHGTVVTPSVRARLRTASRPEAPLGSHRAQRSDRRARNIPDAGKHRAA